MVRLQGPTSPPLRCNRVHPANAAGATPAHASRPAAVSLVMEQTPQLVNSTRPSRHNALSLPPRHNALSSLGFWSRVKNIVKAVAVAAVVAAASAGAALKRVYSLAGSGMASVANAIARLGVLFPSTQHSASEPAPFSENQTDDTQPPPHAIATAAATSAPSACQRYDASAFFMKWSSGFVRVVGSALVYSTSSTPTQAELACASSVLPLSDGRCTAAPNMNGRRNVLAMSWSKQTSHEAIFSFRTSAKLSCC